MPLFSSIGIRVEDQKVGCTALLGFAINQPLWSKRLRTALSRRGKPGLCGRYAPSAGWFSIYAGSALSLESAVNGKIPIKDQDYEVELVSN